MRLKAVAFVTAFCLLSAASANAAAASGADALNAYTSWFSGWVGYLSSINATWNSSQFINAGPSGLSSIIGTITAYNVPTSGTNLVQAFTWYSNPGIIVSTAAPVPVPGPEAGAGLGALALGGIAFLVHRRRRLMRLA